MSTGKRNALGKGLSALLQDNDKESRHHQASGSQVGQQGVSVEQQNSSGQPVFSGAGSVAFVALDRIETNPFQPRTDFNEETLQELADSIRLQGIIQPLTLRRLNSEKFQLISGERRLRASRLAGLTEVPAYVRTADDQEMLEMALIENIQRENLNALEVAISFQRMIEECKLKQEDLGERVSKSRSTVTNYLRLLKLPPQIQSGLKENKITMGHAKALISIPHADRQLWLYSQILRNELSVRKTEELARQSHAEGNSEDKKSKPIEPSYEFRKVQDNLSSHLGTRVQIKLNGNDGGKIEIPFLSTHDLNRILELMN